jgi:hypothetical protein
VQSYATYNYSQHSREQDSTREGEAARPVSLDEESDADPLSLNGHIGHFGVGAQNSAFFMAEQELVVTRQRCKQGSDLGHAGVRELIISEDKLQGGYSRDPMTAYSTSVKRRPPCGAGSALLRGPAHPAPSEPHPVLCELLKSERHRPSFSLMVLSGIKPHHQQELEKLEPSAMTRPMAIADMPFLKQARWPHTLPPRIAGPLDTRLAASSLPSSIRPPSLDSGDPAPPCHICTDHLPPRTPPQAPPSTR